MLVKFFKHGKKGGAIEYLLAEQVRDAATGKPVRRSVAPVVLRGNPEFTRMLYESLPFEHKYTSGVLSFSESSIEDRILHEIAENFENLIYAGLPDDQRVGCWVKHGDKQRVELHFVFPNGVIAPDGSIRAFTPFLYGNRKNGRGRSDLNLIDTWKDLVNARYGLSSPNDPSRRRTLTTSRNLPRPVLDTAQKIDQFITERIQAGTIQNREEVIQHLETAGFTLNRKGKEYLSVKADDLVKPIRLKGALYAENFRSLADLGTRIQPVQGANQDDHAGNAAAVERLAQRLESLVGYRTKRHAERYDGFFGRTASPPAGYTDSNRIHDPGHGSSVYQELAEDNTSIPGGAPRSHIRRRRRHAFGGIGVHSGGGSNGPAADVGSSELSKGSGGSGVCESVDRQPGEIGWVQESENRGDLGGTGGLPETVTMVNEDDGTGIHPAGIIKKLGRRLRAARDAVAAAIDRVGWSIQQVDRANYATDTEGRGLAESSRKFGSTIERLDATTRRFIQAVAGWKGRKLIQEDNFAMKKGYRGGEMPAVMPPDGPGNG